MSDPINTDGTASDWETRDAGGFATSDADWEQRKWGATPHVVPDPLAPEFAVTPEALVVTKAGPWLVAGEWKWRELGREVQLRNKRLPHLTIDLFRSEAEVLFQALGLVLSKPAPLPYRAPWRERLRMWWMRRIWNRKHADELDEHRKAMIADALASLPQMDDAKNQ